VVQHRTLRHCGSAPSFRFPLFLLTQFTPYVLTLLAPHTGRHGRSDISPLTMSSNHVHPLLTSMRHYCLYFVRVSPTHSLCFSLPLLLPDLLWHCLSRARLVRFLLLYHPHTRTHTLPSCGPTHHRRQAGTSWHRETNRNPPGRQHVERRHFSSSIRSISSGTCRSGLGPPNICARRC